MLDSSAPHSSGNNNGGNLKNQSNSQEAGSAANAANAGNAGTGGSGGQLNKLTNWSMHNEDNNTAALTGQQLKQHLQQQRPKSSFELYQEAADILGLSCSLCDNCRCLDCQVSDNGIMGIWLSEGPGCRMDRFRILDNQIWLSVISVLVEVKSIIVYTPLNMVCINIQQGNLKNKYFILRSRVLLQTCYYLLMLSEQLLNWYVCLAQNVARNIKIPILSTATLRVSDKL